MSANKAEIVAALGGSGSGKSAFIKKTLAKSKPKRLLIWDTMDEYGDFAECVPSLEAIRLKLKASKAFALRYVPTGDDKQRIARFNVFCRMAFVVGNVTMVVEELQSVTKPSWAPAGWSDCTLRGRHKGMRIYGASQRPASVDKNFFSNATMIRSGRLNFADDVRVMANVLQVSMQDISALKPLDYIQRDTATGKVERGRLTF